MQSLFLEPCLWLLVSCSLFKVLFLRCLWDVLEPKVQGEQDVYAALKQVSPGCYCGGNH